MSFKKPTKRSIAMLGLLAFVVTFLIATDKGEMRTLAQCAVGQGIGYVPNERAPFTADYHGFKYKGTTKDLIDIQVYIHGTYEPSVLNAIQTLLTSVSDDKIVFLDVGANTGTHTMFVSKFAERVIAIEPWPPILDRLKDHLKSNKITNVEIHPVGYADKKGEMPFFVPPDYNLGWGSFSETFTYGEERPEVIQLPLVTGDEDLKGVPKISGIKLDIEGYEKPALIGLKKRLETDRPLVFFELNVVGDEAFKTMDEIREVFPDNYLFYQISYRQEMVWNIGGNVVLCTDVSGDFELFELEIQDDEFGRNSVAIPAEYKGKFPLEG